MEHEAPQGRTLDDAKALLRGLWTVVPARRQENEPLRARGTGLEARLGQSSSTPSRPPSSDPPSAPAPTRRPPSGRRPGGQPGHVAHRRALLPPEQVDALVVVWPGRGQGCGVALPPGANLVLAAPERHQVSGLPVVQVTVTG